MIGVDPLLNHLLVFRCYINFLQCICKIIYVKLVSLVFELAAKISKVCMSSQLR